MGAKLVVSVSQSAVLQAEAAIMGCARCISPATLPFWRVLDRSRSYVEEDIAYILPALASCPRCRAPIDENTLVAPKPRRKSLSLAFLVRRLIGKARAVDSGWWSRNPAQVSHHTNMVYHEASKSGPEKRSD
jgi:hypothetical protein